MWVLMAFNGTKDYKNDMFVNWGQGEAKSLSNLVEEINAGESELVINASGIHRVLKVVRMDIEDEEFGTLIHHKTILPDGRERILNRRPSGKIIAGENPDHAVSREVLEELELPPHWYSIHAKEVVIEEASSKSYPGLPCQYEVHPFKITILSMFMGQCKNGFVTKESDGQVLHFIWDKNFVPVPKR